MIEYLWGDFLLCAREAGLYVNRAQAKDLQKKGINLARMSNMKVIVIEVV